MYRALFLWLLLASSSTAAVLDSQIFINEFHYDNVGADQDEFVEVVVPTWVTDRSSITLTLYNGGNGRSYRGPVSLDDFTAGDVVDGFAFFFLNIAMQNGSPDGLALAHGTEVLQFLSYEGAFVAEDGVAAGQMSTDILVYEPANTPLGSSLQLAGEGDSYLDFTWQDPAAHTRGTLNLGQRLLGGDGWEPDPGPGPEPDPGPDPGLSEVPEPASLLVWFSGVLTLLGVQHRRRRTSVKDERGKV